MKIVVGFDGSPSAHEALTRVIDLFSEYRPEVVLVLALGRPGTSSDLAEQAWETARKEAEAELEAAAAMVRAVKLRVRARLVEGDPREVLERTTLDEAPDLVAVGARGRGAAARALLGSVSTYAVHHLRVPVLVVR